MRSVLVRGRLAFYGSGSKLLEYFQAEVPADIYDNLTDNNTPECGMEIKQRFLESPLYQEMIAAARSARAGTGKGARLRRLLRRRPRLAAPFCGSSPYSRSEIGI